MSSQQSMFVDPEHQDPEQRARNTDPREQGGDGEGTARYGAEEYYQRDGGKIRPQQPRRGRFLPLVVLLCVLAFFVFGGFSYFAMHSMGRYSGQAQMLQHSSQVAWLPGEQIVINGNASDIHVHTTSGNEVTVQPSGNDSNNSVNIRQDGTELVISVNNQGGIFGSSDTNLDVLIPQNSASLQVENNSGNVQLENVNGTVQVRTDSGDIHVQNLSGQSTLQSSAGDIKVQGINGNAHITANSGDVDVSQAKLDGSSIISTNDGSITYNGTLSTNTLYNFSSSSGDVKLNLAGDAGLQVQTQTQSGNVHNEFGTGPGNVQISTSSGDITVQQRS
jgi:Putative adhesin